MSPPRTAVAVGILVVLAGCLGFGSPPPSDPGAEAVVDSAAAWSAEVESYQYQHDIRVVASGDGETRRVTMDAVGAVNRTTSRMRGSVDYDGTQRDTYVDGGTAYTECQSPWGWATENVSSERDWEAKDALGRQVDMLDASPVTWAGNESIDGVAVHVVEARPSGETLGKYSDRRVGGGLGTNVEDATLTAWITKTEGRVVKTELVFTITEGGATADARMTTHFSEFGEPVSVTIPDEARSAEHSFGCPGG